jgi:hypothetical protein
MGKGIAKQIKEIKEEQIGATSKIALIVEGPDDKDAYELFFKKRNPGWETRYVIVSAGGKKTVLEILKREQNWFGIVDRDEWGDDMLNQIQASHPNLWITPRFCLENYLIVPEELWSAFPPRQQDKIPEGISKFSESLLNDLDKWVAHGVLWSEINPLWEGLRARGFKEDLLSPEVALDEKRIREKLNEWHAFLHPEQIMERFKTKLETVQALSQDQQIKRWVHGKSFYSNVVNPALNLLLGQKAENERRSSIIRTLPFPEDLLELWEKLGLPEEE